jgi:hypothetical protein
VGDITVRLPRVEGEFAAATSMSDLIEDFERLLQRRKPKQPTARPGPK